MFAPHYARPLVRNSLTATSVWQAPCRESPIVSPLNAGDEFAILEIRAGWAWGYRRLNHHVGYVPVADLAVTAAGED